MFAGVDGCRAGWFLVGIDDSDSWSVDLCRSIQILWAKWHAARLILIDIPIGLRDEGATERLCDTEARWRLGPKRGSSVFPAPCRAALGATTYPEACALNVKHSKRRLSKQSWALVPKIRQVNEFLKDTNAANGRIREVHPELCFWALNGARPMVHRKKSREGFVERAGVLRLLYPSTAKIVEEALSKWRRYEVGRDDILDALVAAVTARMGYGALRSIPDSAEHDRYGIAMKMVYYRTTI